MDTRFSRSLARLHRVSATRLADAIGCYQQLDQAPVEGIPLQIDRDVDLTGAGDAFAGCSVAITWQRSALCAASRGGVFVVGAERFTVERLITDDGHMIAAACMVAP